MKTQLTDLHLPDSWISKLFLLAELPNAAKRKLATSGEAITMTKNSLLFTQGESADHFFLILSGGIKLTKKSDESIRSNSTLIDLIGPGELLGVALMLNSKVQMNYPVSAKTIGPTELLKYSMEVFHNTWTSDQDLTLFANKSILKRIENMQNDRCLQRSSLEQKVAYFLTVKLARFKQFRVTRQDIADCIGSSQEAVIRLLSDWTRKGWIESDQHGITVLNLAKVRSFLQDP